MNQLTCGQKTRILYIENKERDIDGVPARIGWVTFSKTGRTVYYRGRILKGAKGRGIAGNFFDGETGEEYGVSGVKLRGDNAHHAKRVHVEMDDDAREEYRRITGHDGV